MYYDCSDLSEIEITKKISALVADETLSDIYNKCKCKYIQNFSFVKNHYTGNLAHSDIENMETIFYGYYGDEVIYKMWVIYENLNIDYFFLLERLDILLYFIRLVNNKKLNSFYYTHLSIQSLLYLKESFIKCVNFIEDNALINFMNNDFDNYLTMFSDLLNKQYNSKVNESLKIKQERVKNYFNFLNFDVADYNKELINFIDVKNKQKYKISDLQINSNYLNQDDITYGILLFKNNMVVDVFYTTRVSEVVGKHLNNIKADSFYIHKIDNKDYAKTLIAELKLVYNIKSNGNEYKTSNYKYSTLKRAKSSYNFKYSISAKAFNKVELENCYVKTLPTSEVIVDKIKLHECIASTINKIKEKIDEEKATKNK